MVEPALLRRLGLERGDQLRIGDALFTVAGEVRSEPDRMEASLAPGPRVFFSMDGLKRSGLSGTTGRMTFKALVESGVDYMEVGYKTNDGIFNPADVGAWRFCEEDDLLRVIDPDAKAPIVALTLED